MVIVYLPVGQVRPIGFSLTLGGGSFFLAAVIFGGFYSFFPLPLLFCEIFV